METRRRFNGTDAYMVERAYTIHGQLTADLAEFTAYDSTINAAFLTSFQTAINTALSSGTDETAQDQQAQLTNTVLVTMRDCQKKYGEVKYFAEKAFPADKALQNEFGTNDYAKARVSQPHMAFFMTTMHGVAVKVCNRTDSQRLFAGTDR